MGCAKKRMNPRVVNHVNRNFVTMLTKMVIKAVYQLPSPWKTKNIGRRGYDPRLVAVCCILKIAFNLSFDGIEAFVKDSVILKIYFPSLPGHSVIHRGMQKLSMRYIRKVMNRVVRFLRRKGMDIAVDSSGFSTTSRSTWYDIRIKRRSSRRECIKLHIGIDVETGVIHSFTITSWNRHDSPEFKRLIQSLPVLGNVVGDKAYSSRVNCQLVADKKGKPYLYFKDNATDKAKGKPAWIISIRKFKKDKEDWLTIYHLRSIIESVFSSIKKRWGSFLRSRKKRMQKRELALKVLVYNLKQVLMVKYAREKGIPLWILVK
jgi:transposase